MTATEALLRAAETWSLASELLRRLRTSNAELRAQRDCLYESSTAPDGVYSCIDDQEKVDRLDAIIAANSAAIARATGELG